MQHAHQPSLHPCATQHNYGTRIRKNSILKPSARLRQTPPSPHPPPRRIKPVPIPAPHHPVPLTPDPSLPVFPLPGVLLHPEDASNKVFHAIGRSFLSVENRAMTIKDLAEMTLKYGLMCQNVSAASQAITTYLRSHMARCETQQDHPLLLRHVLSGTLADDDLVPALYSRSGGATNASKSSLKDLEITDKNVVQGALESERLTNFRRGTMVWYLSKATGVSCPFARAGIRLCEYGKEGRKAAEKHGGELYPLSKRQPNGGEARCGLKRKRLRRGCRRDSDVSHESSSVGRDSQSPALESERSVLSTDSSDDERPQKVKLTFRLRPSLPCAPTLAPSSRPSEVIDLSNDTSSSEDDAGAEDADDVDMCSDPSDPPWNLPPYPLKSIAIPSYTPTCDERAHSSPAFEYRRVVADERRRSSSVSWSASPPPDSDHDDFDFDSDVDWDSSSLSVSSPLPAPQVKVETTDEFQTVEHGPADIRGMLDAWEHLDCIPTSTVSSGTIKLPSTDELKFDTLEFWEWEFDSGWSGASEDQQDFPVVKMEPGERECLPTLQVFTPGLPTPTYLQFMSSSRRFSSSPTSESAVDSPASQSPLSPFVLSASPSFPIEFNTGGRVLAWQDAELLGPDSVHPHEFEDGWASGLRTQADCTLLPQRASDEIASSTAYAEHKQDKVNIARAVVEETETGHAESRLGEAHLSSSSAAIPDIVVVRTCCPCAPDVCATQVEGISVYQTRLGRTLLLRRIDTDFVNLSTILSHLSTSPPSPLPSGCVNVSHHCLSIDGIWAPLNVARLYAHGLPNGIENIFLSDDLVMRFPTALQDFYQKSASGRLLNQFGPHFNESLSVTGSGNPLPTDHGKSVKDGWEGSGEAVHVEEPLLAIPPSVNLALAALHPSTSTKEVAASTETPLSPTEQEIFRALCVHPDWETEETGATCNGRTAESAARDGPPGERPLRRSRRVADAAAARSRAAPPRTKGPRHS